MCVCVCVCRFHYHNCVLHFNTTTAACLSRNNWSHRFKSPESKRFVCSEDVRDILYQLRIRHIDQVLRQNRVYRIGGLNCMFDPIEGGRDMRDREKGGPHGTKALDWVTRFTFEHLRPMSCCWRVVSWVEQQEEGHDVTRFCLYHINNGVGSYLQKLSSLIVLPSLSSSASSTRGAPLSPPEMFVFF